MAQTVDWLIDGEACECCEDMLGDGDPSGYPRMCCVCATDARGRGFKVNERGHIIARPGPYRKD